MQGYKYMQLPGFLRFFHQSLSFNFHVNIVFANSRMPRMPLANRLR